MFREFAKKDELSGVSAAERIPAAPSGLTVE